MRRCHRRHDTRAQSERAGCLRQGQSGQAVILVVGHRQSAAAGGRIDEQHGRNSGAARALSRLGSGRHGRRNGRGDHELLESCRCLAADAGRQDSRDRGYLARADAAIARRGAAQRRRARSCGLRIAQLVRDVRHCGHAARDRRASQFHCEYGAQGSGHRRQVAATGHRAEADEGCRVQGLRRRGAHEVRKDRRASQYQIEQLIYRLLVLSETDGLTSNFSLCRSNFSSDNPRHLSPRAVRISLTITYYPLGDLRQCSEEWGNNDDLERRRPAHSRSLG